MLHISVITCPDTYVDELVEIFLKLSIKEVEVHLIIWTTLAAFEPQPNCLLFVNIMKTNPKTISTVTFMAVTIASAIAFGHSSNNRANF